MDILFVFLLMAVKTLGVMVLLCTVWTENVGVEVGCSEASHRYIFLQEILIWPRGLIAESLCLAKYPNEDATFHQYTIPAPNG